MIAQPERVRIEFKRGIKMAQPLTGMRCGRGQAKTRLDQNTPGGSLRCWIVGRGKRIRC